MLFIFLTAIILFCIGFASVVLARKIYLSARRLEAERDASKIISEAKELAEILMGEKKESSSRYEKQLKKRAERDIQKIESSVQKIEKAIQQKESEHQSSLDKKYNRYSQEKSNSKKQQDHAEFKKRKVDQRVVRLKEVQQNYIDRLLDKSDQSKENVVNLIVKKLLSRAQVETQKKLQEDVEEGQVVAERKAREVVHIALSRFSRPFCPDRGLGYISFTKPEIATRLVGPERVNLKHIEKVCGVDLIYDEKNMSISVSGFDPVRRELARSSIEKMIHDKGLNEKRIETLVAKTKKELFKKVRNNGESFARELKFKNISPEIKNTIGTLMYRYSFSQNQFFHCTEVGYLCGLLSSELELSQDDGRRAGGLHDIGKSMDHSIDGGHAVIGADFIERHGEEPHIVHAVRAHHFDETPKTELAYLVIAADAISGARPGARRSTANTYIQKMEDLEVAASSFEEVTDTLILSAGREVRVQVNGSKVKDMQALQLSKKIAKKIQEDCSFPGTIKVTVVRKTQAIEYAK